MILTSSKRPIHTHKIICHGEQLTPLLGFRVIPVRKESFTLTLPSPLKGVEGIEEEVPQER